jgi:hypothetical protein
LDHVIVFDEESLRYATFVFLLLPSLSPSSLIG